MTAADPYLWLKALHVGAAITFAAGVLVLAVASAAAPRDSSARTTFVPLARRWDARVTTPAMLTTWGAGLGLAMLGGWFPQGWLIAKLGVVVLLSGLHGALSGRLRRLASGNAGPSSAATPAFVIGGVGLIAVLAVVKPF